MLKICEKNSSVNLRLEIFVMAFRVRKLFGTFEKRAPGSVQFGTVLIQSHVNVKVFSKRFGLSPSSVVINRFEVARGKN